MTEGNEHEADWALQMTGMRFLEKSECSSMEDGFPRQTPNMKEQCVEEAVMRHRTWMEHGCHMAVAGWAPADSADDPLTPLTTLTAVSGVSAWSVGSGGRPRA